MRVLNDISNVFEFVGIITGPTWLDFTIQQIAQHRLGNMSHVISLGGGIALGATIYEFCGDTPFPKISLVFYFLFILYKGIEMKKGLNASSLSPSNPPVLWYPPPQFVLRGLLGAPTPIVRQVPLPFVGPLHPTHPSETVANDLPVQPDVINLSCFEKPPCIIHINDND